MDTKKLKELLTLAQVSQLMGQPQEQQAQLDQRDQEAKLTAAVHLLGLHQQVQEGGLDRALKQQQVTQTGVIANQGDATEREKLAANREMKDATLKIEQEKNANNIIDAVIRDPQIDPALKLEIGVAHSPVIAQAYATHGAKQTAQAVEKIYPAVSAVANNPLKLHTIMSTLPEAVQAGVKAKIPQLQYAGAGTSWGDTPLNAPPPSAFGPDAVDISSKLKDFLGFLTSGPNPLSN